MWRLATRLDNAALDPLHGPHGNHGTLFGTYDASSHPENDDLVLVDKILSTYKGKLG